MLTSTFRAKVAKAAAGVAAVGLAIGAAVVGGPAAGADPKQFSAFVGMGSDTTQDIMNALAGEANGKTYTPVRSSQATGFVQVTSWDATGTTCITPKAPGATMNRPNGSTQGRRALSRAIDKTTYGTTACGANATGKAVSGLVDFARSSSGPASGDTGTALTYIPFGRDGVSFAFYRASGGAPVSSLTHAELNALFTTGPQTIGGVNVIPCGIQTGSGTFEFWNKVVGASLDQENTATATCNALAGGTAPGGRIQENAADQLKAKGDAAPAGSQVVVGFSAANFISQSNGVAKTQLASGVDLGSISDNGSGSDLGKPYTGTAPNTAPNATFYNDAKFGRDVYNVLDTARATGLGNNDIKSIFVGSSSSMCSAPVQSIVNTFGFLSIAGCGSTTLTGSLISGTL